MNEMRRITAQVLRWQLRPICADPCRARGKSGKQGNHGICAAGVYELIWKKKRDGFLTLTCGRLFYIQMKKYQAEQNQIADIKEFVARFGHGRYVRLLSEAMAPKVGEMITYDSHSFSHTLLCTQYMHTRYFSLSPPVQSWLDRRKAAKRFSARWWLRDWQRRFPRTGWVFSLIYINIYTYIFWSTLVFQLPFTFLPYFFFHSLISFSFLPSNSSCPPLQVPYLLLSGLWQGMFLYLLALCMRQ